MGTRRVTVYVCDACKKEHTSPLKFTLKGQVLPTGDTDATIESLGALGLEGDQEWGTWDACSRECVLHLLDDIDAVEKTI